MLLCEPLTQLPAPACARTRVRRCGWRTAASARCCCRATDLRPAPSSRSCTAHPPPPPPPPPLLLPAFAAPLPLSPPPTVPMVVVAAAAGFRRRRGVTPSSSRPCPAAPLHSPFPSPHVSAVCAGEPMRAGARGAAADGGEPVQLGQHGGRLQLRPPHLHPPHTRGAPPGAPACPAGAGPPRRMLAARRMLAESKRHLSVHWGLDARRAGCSPRGVRPGPARSRER